MRGLGSYLRFSNVFTIVVLLEKHLLCHQARRTVRDHPGTILTNEPCVVPPGVETKLPNRDTRPCIL